MQRISLLPARNSALPASPGPAQAHREIWTVCFSQFNVGKANHLLVYNQSILMQTEPVQFFRGVAAKGQRRCKRISLLTNSTLKLHPFNKSPGRNINTVVL